MIRKVAGVLLALLLAYAGLCAALYFGQRSFLYFPQPRHDVRAATMALASDQEKILVTVRQAEGTDAVIYFGGNAEDVSYNLPQLAEAFPNRGLYLMHYRGYGGSSGSPSEAALVDDARALFDEVAKKHAHIVVIGRSLGSGVAVQLASARPVERLILVTPYNSIQELAQRQFTYVPVSWILRDKFESWRFAGKISAPTLLIAAERDEVIPAWSTRALHSHFSQGVASIQVLPGASHNTVSDSSLYVPLLQGAK